MTNTNAKPEVLVLSGKFAGLSAAQKIGDIVVETGESDQRIERLHKNLQ